MSKLLALAGVALLLTTAYLSVGTQKFVPKNKEIKKAFEKWTQQYQFNMNNEESFYRFSVFVQNYIKVQENNANPESTVELGLTQFAVYTQEEFEAQFLGLAVEQPEEYEVVPESSNAEIDWRTKGAITPVKNQGRCGSCWAFSANGALEAHAFIKGGKTGDFSEQQLVDCSGSYGNQGCRGGLMTSAFAYIKDKGITTGAAYPYAGVDQTCKVQGGSYKISGSTNVPAGNCNAQADFLQKQPVSVAVDASNWSLYKSGIFSNCATRLNHGVTLVANLGGLWHIKNSWGTSWGESGYIRLKGGNTCGVCAMSTVPNL